MKHKLYSLLLAALLGAGGTQAWAQELSTTEIDGVTYYTIGTADELVAFADLVKEGETSANGILTADIALAEPWETPIGTSEATAYRGIFDGQGHKITGFEMESAANGGGLFGFTSAATVKDFSISGTLISTAGTGSGVIGYPANSTITGIHSALEIDVPVASVHHVGGVVGSARGGNTVTGCTYSGSMYVAAGSTDNFAGVVAYIGGDNICFCANYGTISFDDAGCAAGGVAGYLNNNTSSIMGCLNMGMVVCTETEGTAKYGGAIVGRIKNSYSADLIRNNFYLEGSAVGEAAKKDDGSFPLAYTESVTAEQLASGEVCYLLNGDQTVIGWYQTLGTDEQPVLDATHAQVYMNGRLHCNGDVYEGAVFSNTDAGTIQDDHDIVDGFCTYCGIFDADYMAPNADGYYEIATAKQLVWFEQKVNRGTLDANAVLTADIDFADLMPEGADPDETEADWTPIGDWGQARGTASSAYKGHFNGQGHSIRNFNVTSSVNYYGLFGVVSEGSLIEDFSIYGTLNLGHKTGGVVAYTRDTACTIRGIHSFLTLNVTEANTTAERPGGIIGSAVNGTTNIENCTYSGILNAGGHTGNIGGIVGYINNNSAAIVNITNCLFDGEIQNGDSADGQCGGIVGYNNGGKATIKNCLSIGTIVSSEGNIGQFIGRLNGSNTVFANNYYLGEFVNGTKSGKTAGGSAPVLVDAEQLFSGEVAWKLNEETFLDAVWHQTLDEDKYPVPGTDGAIVYQTPTGYDCISPDEPESFESFRDGIIANEQEFINSEDLVACQALIDEYKEAIESWKDINSYDEFIAAYKASFELKESIKQSVISYGKYKTACEAAAAYMEENSLEGVWAKLLKSYLEEDVEPGSEFPNGSFAYIMENCNLDEEGIVEEIAFVNQLLENAIAGGITAGTEITRLLANPAFADGFEGWQTESDGITFATGGQTELMRIARGLGNGTFNVSQTLSELPAGIYMVAANGMFRSGDDINSKFYAGQLYLNGTANYVMSPGDDVINEEEAEPGVNCLGDDGDAIYLDDYVSGYVPKSINGCSYAFSAGRYQNYSATEVTDGTLTVGVRSLGTGANSDWLPFGNLHVCYLGTADEANDQLADILASFADRAQAIVDSESSIYEEYVLYPGMSESLKSQLSDAIASVGSAETGKQKMELIGKFSDLFNETHACRRAYISMLDASNNLTDMLDPLLDAGLITEDDYDDWYIRISEAQNHFEDGDISTEEALAIAQEMNFTDQMLPKLDDVYQLATVDHLKLFAMTVNCGQNNVKAVLTADIDMSEVEVFEPIGSTGYPFMGEFDGQGHKITGFGRYDEELGYYTLELSGDKQGFFGYVKNATVGNFSIEGTIAYNGGTGYGAIGWAEGSTLQDIHSSLNIASTSTSHHIGGVCGDMRAGSKAIGCSFSGTIVDSHNTHDCIGGIGGYSNENCLYENCANYGTIEFSNAGAYASGICGYVNNDDFIGVLNCLSTGSVKTTNGTAPTYGGAIIGRLRSHSSSKLENNFWLEGSAARAYGDNASNANATAATAEQLASGEICFALNGGQEEPSWFQTLAEDLYPVLDPTHKVVLFAEDKGYYNDGGITGDLNGDGKVDIADAVTVLNIMAAGTDNPEADLNSDGKVDIADFVTVLNIMAEQ